MAIQVVRAREKVPSTAAQFAQAFGESAGKIGSAIGKGYGSKLRQEEENEALKREYGVDFSGISDPNQRKMLAEKIALTKANQLKGDNERDIQSIYAKGLRGEELSPKELSKLPINAQTQLNKAKQPPKEPKKPLTEKEVPTEISKKIKKVLADNPKANADELRIEMDDAGIPPVYSNPYTENRRRTEEQQAKTKEAQEANLRAETLPIRKDLADRANAARAGIQNKTNLLNIIKTGKIDDPSIAAIADALPFNLGKRILSPETLEYKAGLVDDFKDLSTIFKGATRVKEVEIYENKIADTYLTDEQKEAVLKARINSLKADVIRGEVAAELEKEGKFFGALTFEEEVNKRAKPQLDALFEQVWNETKNVLDIAESRKKLPLDVNDPDDLQIIDQIIKEAGGNAKKAEELAKKRGYKF